MPTLADMPPVLDIGLSPFDATPDWILESAAAAERVGFQGVWMMDHMSGVVADRSSSMEAFTLLGAVAAVTDDVAIGTLVVNQMNRHPALLAASAATLQSISGGRAVLGLGLGTGAGGPYAREQIAIGRRPESGALRRERLREVVAVVRGLWQPEPFSYDGAFYTVMEASGWPVADPAPPIIVGAGGRLGGALAGEIADGVNVAADSLNMEETLSAARKFAAGRPFIVSAYARLNDAARDPTGELQRRMDEAGVARLVLFTAQADAYPIA